MSDLNVKKNQCSDRLQTDKIPLAVVMITLNEGHNMEAVLKNIQGWAQEIFLVDSYSSDDTIDIALKYGIHVVQRKFCGFGEQWNFALQELPIKSPWVMKLDPDERLTDELKIAIEKAITKDEADGLSVSRRLWFMGRALPIKQTLVRVWRAGKCRFTQVLVNEHPVVDGLIQPVDGVLDHHDSPDLHHWYNKQNKYSTAEALTSYRGDPLAVTPRLLGNSFQRRMWLKKNFSKIPFRYSILFLYNYIYLGTWRAGRVGYIWSRLRIDVYRARAYKLTEMKITQKEPNIRGSSLGKPDDRVTQY